MIAPCAFSQSSGSSSSIASNFNGTSVPGGNYIWFSAVFQPTTQISKTSTTDIYVSNQTISFTANGVNYNLSVPNSQITFSPTALIATTVFNASTNTWVTTIPASGNLSGNAFLSGFAFQVPAGGLPGGINPVTWSGSFSTDQTGLGLDWQWAAANYNSLSSDYNALGIKPVDSNDLSSYLNSDHAGAPENFLNDLGNGGARGGSGSNYTGSYSATGSDNPSMLQGSGQLIINTTDTSNLPTLQTRVDKSYDIQATYTVPDSTSKLYLTRTSQARQPNNVFGPATQDPNSPYSYSPVQTGFAVTQDFGNSSPIVNYGLETWTLSYGPANGTSAPIVLDTKQVYIYKKTTADFYDAMKLGTTATSLAGAIYQGDTPRVRVVINDSYPGGRSWVVFYPGPVASSPPQNVAAITSTSYSTAKTDENPKRTVYVDVGNLMQNSGTSSPGTYSIQVLQSTAAYSLESAGAAQFTINPSFQITSEVGLTK